MTASIQRPPGNNSIRPDTTRKYHFPVLVAATQSLNRIAKKKSFPGEQFNLFVAGLKKIAENEIIFEDWISRKYTFRGFLQFVWYVTIYDWRLAMKYCDACGGILEVDDHF